MEFFHRAAGRPQRVCVLAGAFNPVTVAHLALARAALSHYSQDFTEVVFVLPKLLPHKIYHGAPFAQRVEILRAAISEAPGFSIAASNGGLFLEIAAELRQVYTPEARLSFLCGRDAAERILNWDYGDPDAAARMLRDFNLLVAARDGGLAPAENVRHAVESLTLTGEFDHVSSTEIRDRIARGLPWEHLAPKGAQELVKRAYR